jgi:hypothetical protein
MNENLRKAPRFKVMMTLTFTGAGGQKVTLHVNDLSVRGFQACGPFTLSPGDKIEAALQVEPLSGPREVHLNATVMHVEKTPECQFFGAHIDAFGAREEELAYVDYVQELSADSL